MERSPPNIQPALDSDATNRDKRLFCLCGHDLAQHAEQQGTETKPERAGKPCPRRTGRTCTPPASRVWLHSLSGSVTEQANMIFGCLQQTSHAQKHSP
ncbi:hypothetical protein AA19596_0965 [Acetobacter fabarum DSM 19596]|nr:hypothetical protein AA19596_0965 [Acetobacter fabarum DSM 19596]